MTSREEENEGLRQGVRANNKSGGLDIRRISHEYVFNSFLVEVIYGDNDRYVRCAKRA